MRLMVAALALTILIAGCTSLGGAGDQGVNQDDSQESGDGSGGILSGCEKLTPTINRPDLAVDSWEFDDTNTVDVTVSAHSNGITLTGVTLEAGGRSYTSDVDRELPFGEATTVTVETSNSQGQAFSSGECASATLSVSFDKSPFGGGTVTADGELQGEAP